MADPRPALPKEAESRAGLVPTLLIGVVGLALGAVAYAAMIGLGVHRHGAPWAVSLVATALVFGPPLLGAAAARRRGRVFGIVLAGWSFALVASLPVYFPGERRQAIATGLSLVGSGESWQGAIRSFTELLPDEPVLSQPEIPEASESVAAIPPGPLLLADHQIALPYEGEGRRLAVPVAFEHEGKTLETWMLLDTGATYTTLPEALIRRLGVESPPSAPVIRLQTANGEREARLVLLEKVWLGDLPLEGVAIATCETCTSDDTSGLLGLNVTGGYNLFIDADRREVVFTARPDRDQRLDISHFVDLSATFSRYPGGRIEVSARLRNDSPRPIRWANAAIRCGDERWTVELSHIDPGETATQRTRLPDHAPCAVYEIALDSAGW